MKLDVIRNNFAVIGIAVALWAVPSTIYAERNDGAVAIRLPERARVSNAEWMEKAFKALPSSCRKAVQRELALTGLAVVPADGAWSLRVAEGMVRYVSSFVPLAHGWHTMDGATGLYRNVAPSEPSCGEAARGT